MIFFYLTFGPNLEVHRQAVFSAMTILGAPRPEVSIIVLTDAPEYYRFLGDRVTVRVTSAAELRDWRGPHDFFWRIKIKALEDLARRHPEEHLVYLDADTFCFGSLPRMRALLDGGTHLMHAREGTLAELPTRTERRMWQQCENRSFGGLTVDGASTMYNAGVVGLSAGGAARAVEIALRICDDMCAAGVIRRLIEQFALSVALASAGRLAAANFCIGHYWGNKEGWNTYTADFFLEHHLRATSLDEQLAAAGRVDFGVLPIYGKSSRTRDKLVRWVNAVLGKNIYAFVPDTEGEVSDLSERRLARKGETSPRP
ncbi:hypothetical protein [Lewinella sp. JB7]|uniref:hypothetical protein n=1 Tax=Lewinella sp. JB7 TaxID=2962887 RepID=UPI0020C97ADE|nr:hypothetical protein [Lewinella sp. JB7]MCP9234997.1 hypothetical protein [Lewinella sp. JB7]